MNGSNAKNQIESFKTWLVANGGYIHPDVDFVKVSSGYNVIALQDIPADMRTVSCPFSLAITPQVSQRALRIILAANESLPALSQWSERQLICTYLCMHRILDPSKAPPELAHRPYVDVLPSADRLRTPLHFSRAEMDLFRGTNLYGATLDRQKTWEAEWEDCRDLIASRDADLGERFTWIEYLTASTHLSSRAFPSTLLSETPSLISTPTSYPVLLPGVDSLNHARAQPVSWVVTHPGSTTSYVPVPSAPTISLVLHTRTQRGAELFNNYGPKPNAELILGYGFALPANPDDTIVLKIGGLEGAPSSKWEVGRGARGAEPVWEAVKAAVHAQNRYDVEEEERASYSTEDDLWATEVLVDMADDLLNRLPPNPSTGDVAGSDPDVRPEVREMLHYYLEGQQDILRSLMDFARAKEERIVEFAREQGIEIVEDLN